MSGLVSNCPMAAPEAGNQQYVIQIQNKATLKCTFGILSQ